MVCGINKEEHGRNDGGCCNEHTDIISLHWIHSVKTLLLSHTGIIKKVMLESWLAMPGTGM